MGNSSVGSKQKVWKDTDHIVVVQWRRMGLMKATRVQSCKYLFIYMPIMRSYQVDVSKRLRHCIFIRR